MVLYACLCGLWVEKRIFFPMPGAWSIEYIADLHDYTDGITRLWEFTQSHTGPPNEYLFKSSATNSYVTYDSMLAVLLHRLATQLNLPNPQQIGWHSCRKTRGRWRARHAGTEGDMAAVRHVLGHSANSLHGVPPVIYLLLLPPTLPQQKEDKRTIIEQSGWRRVKVRQL